jgi:hypothetical protein
VSGNELTPSLLLVFCRYNLLCELAALQPGWSEQLDNATSETLAVWLCSRWVVCPQPGRIPTRWLKPLCAIISCTLTFRQQFAVRTSSCCLCDSAIVIHGLTQHRQAKHTGYVSVLHSVVGYYVFLVCKTTHVCPCAT